MPMKLPLKRPAIPNSEDRRVTDASGEDVARIVGKQIAFSAETSLALVQAVNGRERLEREVELLRAKLATFRQSPKDLKPIDLGKISRCPNALFTAISFEDPYFRDLLVVEGKNGVKRARPWLHFGASEIQQTDRMCTIGGRMRDGITDFEHDSCKIVCIDLLGLQFKFTSNHVSHFEATLSPDPEHIRLYDEDFVPEKMEGTWQCEDEHCEDEHWMLPDGHFVPPVYKLARLVAGQRVSITMGTRWDFLEGRTDEEE